MANKQELVTITGTEISFNNKQLNTATRNIYGYVFGMEKNKFKMAAEMSRILENNLFVDDFENFETYAGKVFNLKKAMAYNYAAIGKDWIARNEKGNPTGESILPHDTVDYQITKILALMKVGVEQATEWANDGTINPFMSVKEIKDIIKDWDAKQNTIDVEATETENEPETETESAEQETEQETEQQEFMRNVNASIDRFYSNIVHLRWTSFSDFGLNEAFYNYYYAENRLYIIRDGLTEQLFFVQADSPKDAFMKFNRRMEDALNAGKGETVGNGYCGN